MPRWSDFPHEDRQSPPEGAKSPNGMTREQAASPCPDPPGSEGKEAYLTARWFYGLPMWLEDDYKPHAPTVTIYNANRTADDELASPPDRRFELELSDNDFDW